LDQLVAELRLLLDNAEELLTVSLPGPGDEDPARNRLKATVGLAQALMRSLQQRVVERN
jgi:ElaB/YqjD/DUF883 family membrane-anchored ribosome-binding protein